MKIDDDTERKRPHGYDPQAPITRKGYLFNLRTKKPMEIKENDMVIFYFNG